MDFGSFSCHDCMKQYFVSTIPVFCIRKNIHPYQMGDDISLGCNTQRLSTQTGSPRRQLYIHNPLLVLLPVLLKIKFARVQPGFEHGTFCTRSRIHTTRPLSQRQASNFALLLTGSICYPKKKSKILTIFCYI